MLPSRQNKVDLSVSTITLWGIGSPFIEDNINVLNYLVSIRGGTEGFPAIWQVTVKEGYLWTEA